MDAVPQVAKRWAFEASIDAFLGTEPHSILGALVDRSRARVEEADSHAWREEIAVLQRELSEFKGRGHVYFEYDIPRLGKRIDVVVVLDHVLFVLEFKVGATAFASGAVAQAWDYALDLKYFQSACRDIPIIPILVATEVQYTHIQPPEFAQDGVARPLRCNGRGVHAALFAGLAGSVGDRLDAADFERGRYQPTPTIIEAARALYANHNVEDITRQDAGARNLATTSARVNEIIAESKRLKQKSIVFVTGVPGAGKTLVGLDVATKQSDDTDHTHSVFLSGNGPLVAVLRAALAGDEVARAKADGQSITKGEADRRVKTFIQNVHHFRDDCLSDERPPANHVALFDEAQRAWDLPTTSDFMRRKKNQPDFDQSEPQFLVSCMNRHDWAVVVCLVGGGQEINKGEAGIREWLKAVGEHFRNWEIYLSPKLGLDRPEEADAIEAAEKWVKVHRDEALHLATSIRSFRSEYLSAFVNDLLDLKLADARSALQQILPKFPIRVSRDLEAAKEWLRAQARGSERFGIVASSGAQRLRPLGVDVRVKIDPVYWFLKGPDDVRSSNYVEDLGTEFQVQGLELDWTCVVWDADLRLEAGQWGFYSFKGTRWNKVNAADRRRYLLNAYRVLLTRARQGMVIVVPEGEAHDPTRPSAYYDAVFQMLREDVGLPPIQ